MMFQSDLWKQSYGLAHRDLLKGIRFLRFYTFDEVEEVEDSKCVLVERCPSTEYRPVLRISYFFSILLTEEYAR